MTDRYANKYQFGIEASAGTAVAADTLIVGPEIRAIDPDREPTFHEDNLGYRARSNRLSMGAKLWNHTIAIPELYYQFLPAGLSCALKGNVTPAEQTASEGDYLWDNTPALSGDNSVDSMTLELGDNTQAYESEYFQFQRLRLRGAINQNREFSPVAAEFEGYGRQLTKTSFTGAISVPSVTTLNAKRARLYADSTFANVGNTELTNLIRSFELEIITGMHPKLLGSANDYFDDVGQSFVEVMLTLAFERGSNSSGEYDVFTAGTKQAVRLELDSGVQIGAGVNHKLTFDIWGAYEYVRPIDSEDQGNNIDAALFHGMFDETASDLFDVQTITNVSAI